MEQRQQQLQQLQQLVNAGCCSSSIPYALTAAGPGPPIASTTPEDSDEAAGCDGESQRPPLPLTDCRLECAEAAKLIETGLRVMWEANRSCRAAGYTEAALPELSAWGSCCSGLPSRMDVPGETLAMAREAGAAVLKVLRQLAGLAWPDCLPPAAEDTGSSGGDSSVGGGGTAAAARTAAAEYADWEVLQAELLLSPSESAPPASSLPASPPSDNAPPERLLSSSLSPASNRHPGSVSEAVAAPQAGAENAPPAASLLELRPDSQPSMCEPGMASPYSSCWGEGLWCFNPACTNLSGPSELALKTLACGGGCGARYCSPECQAQGWRDGHRLSCGRLRDRRVVGSSSVVV